MLDKLEWAAIPSSTLNIPATLECGQNFRWARLISGDNSSDWIGVVEDFAVRLRPGESGFWWQTYPKNGQWDLLHRYFALDVDLGALYDDWIVQEPRIASSIARNAGLRILRQEAEEAFFSFLCASCNTVSKIKRSVRALAAEYGEPLAEIDGRSLYRFPKATQLARASEEMLRASLWGYRAPRVIAAARTVAEQGEDWLQSLRDVPYREAHHELTSLHGIGDKIADCICLFGLWHDEACPIDTHVRQIAVRLYKPKLSQKSLTPIVYETLAGALRQRFGQYTGWAQQYLFFDDLQHIEDI